MRTWVMPSVTHSSTILRNSSTDMIPCRRCMSSRGQNTHLALQMFVLSICTISGMRGARSRPVAIRRRRTGFAWARNRRSAARRVRALMFRNWDMSVLELAKMLDHAGQGFVQLDAWLVADERLDARDVGHPSRHV